jgi:putative peptide zinc metalloprotease protein
MASPRSTFSDSWHKVADLSPRLRTTVHVYRQQFRGRTWHVARDSTNNQSFRLNEPGYYFIALLDGRRRVADAWMLCNDRLGDDAPTQNEVVELLGQLYSANLLYCELPGDSEVLFRRYRKRIRREIQGKLSSVLFTKIPLFNPNHFLNRWVWWFGCVFTWIGGLSSCAILILGLSSLAGHWESLQNSASGILSESNLPWLYICFVMTKVFHEFGHAFACKRFGRLNGTGGDVYEMGIMLLVFTPVPYVDASSAWAFRSKWERIVVSAAGMLTEFVTAGVAALIWANTSEGTLTHALAYNVIFISGVSTLLFNANPLLRYDGYYILSDLLEVPNLAAQSRKYLYFLVKRYLWGVKSIVHPSVAGEHAWLLVYAIASTIYRTLVGIAIILFIADKFFFFGVLLAIGAVVTMGLVPLFNLVRYLASSGELTRVRRRAVGTTTVLLGSTVCALLLVPVPYHLRAEGVVEPTRIAHVHAQADGFVRDVAASGTIATPSKTALVVAENAQLEMELRNLIAEVNGNAIRKRLALRESDVAAVQVYEERRVALDDQMARKREELASLTVFPPLTGTWISPDIENQVGAFIRRGEPIGVVADLTHFFIRAAADQFTAAILVADAHRGVEIRARSRPDIACRGTILDINPAGHDQLPAQSLSIFAGGSVETKGDDPTGRSSVEPFFEVRVDPERQQFFRAGQRVVIRFSLPAKPLGLQWWRSIEQLIQRRFRV